MLLLYSPADNNNKPFHAVQYVWFGWPWGLGRFNYGENFTDCASCTPELKLQHVNSPLHCSTQDHCRMPATPKLANSYYTKLAQLSQTVLAGLSDCCTGRLYWPAGPLWHWTAVHGFLRRNTVPFSFKYCRLKLKPWSHRIPIKLLLKSALQCY